MLRCWLKGQPGDTLHAVVCAAGYNLSWLLRAIVRLGLGPLLLVLAWLRCCPTDGRKPCSHLPNLPSWQRTTAVGRSRENVGDGNRILQVRLLTLAALCGHRWGQSIGGLLSEGHVHDALSRLALKPHLMDLGDSACTEKCVNTMSIMYFTLIMTGGKVTASRHQLPLPVTC